MPQLAGCHVCGGELVALGGYPLTCQVTSDCRVWQGEGHTAVCSACGTVQKSVTENWIRETRNIYAGYAVYSQGGGVEQASFDQDAGSSMARSQKIVDWLKGSGTISETGALLDVGCGNGAFLRAFGPSYPNWRLEGLELDARNQAMIESIPGVTKLHACPIEGLKTRYDLIALIHVLEHIPDPIHYLQSLSSLLKPGGLLLIEVPDLERSPFDILIADHCTHFTDSSLSRVVGKAGFAVSRLDTTCVAKEITLLTRYRALPDQADIAMPVLTGEILSKGHIAWLQRLLEQGQTSAGPLGIFGTSIAGTWLASALGSKIEFFVDEDTNRIGRKHLGRPIYSPNDAPKGSNLLMPLRADIAAAVRQRLLQFDCKCILPPAASPASRGIPMTKEPQYSIVFDVKEKHGISRLGLMTNESWNQDPKRTLFTLARYKFVAKLLAGAERVLEIGCADAFGTRLVQQTVAQVTAVDFDPVFIEDVKARLDPAWPMECFVHDLLDGPVPGQFDAIYSLDVLEHINPDSEARFVSNMLKSLDAKGVVIVGMPSLESQAYASPQSKAGHVNCKSGDDLKALLKRYFDHVFLFSMNDEIVHTGFYPMAHYLIALCCGKKSDNG